MADLTTLARPYAKAAFEYARDAKDLQTWQDALSVAAAVAQQETVIKLLSSPSHTSEQQAKALIEVCGDTLSDKIQNFIYTLADNKRLPLLPEIAVLFAALKAQQEKAVELNVTSAFELSETIQDKLAKALSAKLDRDVSVESSIDSSLIGGVIVRAGDTVIDGSVRGRLAKLAEVMNA